MTVLPDPSHLLVLCRAYCDATGLSEVRVADLATGNPHFFVRLRAGKGCTIATYCRAIRWLSDHWPAHAAWSPDIPRPAPRTTPSPAESATCAQPAAAAGDSDPDAIQVPTRAAVKAMLMGRHGGIAGWARRAGVEVSAVNDVLKAYGGRRIQPSKLRSPHRVEVLRHLVRLVAETRADGLAAGALLGLPEPDRKNPVSESVGFATEPGAAP